MDGTQGAAGFREYGLKATKRFLKTAIVIDDEIIAEPEVVPVAMVVTPAFAEKPVAQAAKELSDQNVTTGDAEVPIKPLADAFLDKQIICGVLKPAVADEDKNVIERAVRAASVADVVIIDWYLRKADDKLALSIIERILSIDKDMNGRLRLILVYTSADPLAERRLKLAQHVREKGFEALEDVNDDKLLTVGTCRVRFVKKKSLGNGTPVEALPDLAIEEFAKLSDGLLANFALLGIGALRDATHHLLANLDRRMDHAFVGHRMLVGEQVSAHDFAMSLFMLQMKSVLSLPTRLGGALSDEELGAWFDDRFSYATAEDHLKGVGLEKNALRSAMLAGTDRKRDIFHQALFFPEAAKSPDKIEQIEKLATQNFARLSTFIRESAGFNPLPDGWLPTLSLGTIVKTSAKKPKYYMCIQPLCDTVRIKAATYFPFIELVAPTSTNPSSQSTENIIIRDGQKILSLFVNLKAGSRLYVKFEPDAVYGAVKATKEEDGYAFEDFNEAAFWWIGDVDPMKAQRVAVDVAGALARVGIDEYEWLRRGGQLKK